MTYNHWHPHANTNSTLKMYILCPYVPYSYTFFFLNVGTRHFLYLSIYVCIYISISISIYIYIFTYIFSNKPFWAKSVEPLFIPYMSSKIATEKPTIFRKKKKKSPFFPHLLHLHQAHTMGHFPPWKWGFPQIATKK